MKKRIKNAPEPDAPKAEHQQWKAQMEEIYASNIKPVDSQYRELYVMPAQEVGTQQQKAEGKN